jgi:hypothetical protein
MDHEPGRGELHGIRRAYCGAQAAEHARLWVDDDHGP